MSKVESKRSKKSQYRKKSTLSLFRIILISSFLTLTVGMIFAIVQFLGETFGFLPVIQLGNLRWGLSGDPIIIFIIGLLSTVFLGSVLVLVLLRYRINK